MSDFLVSFGLVEHIIHFRQRLYFHNMQQWWQVRQGRLLHLPCNYFFGSACQLFETVGIRDLRNFAQDNVSLGS